MSSRRDDRDDHRHQTTADDPPMSRLFVICNKNQDENDFREAFSKFGEIEEIWVVQDKYTGENKGIAYIKFCKTSSAANALEDMNGQIINGSSRPIKVVVASSRNQGSGRQENEQEKYIRLFVIVPKEMTEDDLRAEFEKYGEVENVTMLRDKVTKESKGFAYVKYTKFSHAAYAFENCDPKFKAVFAEPKSSTRNTQGNFSDRSDFRDARSSRYDDFSYNDRFDMRGRNNRFGSSQTTLNITCSHLIDYEQLWRLFDIIPGLVYCEITGECDDNRNFAIADYATHEAALYAREKLHGFEYPLDEQIMMRPLLADTKPNPENIFGFEGTKKLVCSVSLPAPMPMAEPGSSCVQRCFIVCVQKALPSNILSNVFSRFGSLLDVYMLPNKNCGYAKYANESSAQNAIQTLNGAEVCGVKLKVMEAEEQQQGFKRRHSDDE